MGAVAITTLAGSTLILDAEQSALLREFVPFLKGFTLFFWAFGSWWIPLLLILSVWRHLIKRFPLTYGPQFWGIVFPLGMYYRLHDSACTSVRPALPPHHPAWIYLPSSGRLAGCVCRVGTYPRPKRAGSAAGPAERPYLGPAHCYR